MKKISVVIIISVLIYFFIPEKEFIIKNKKFIVHEHGTYKLVDSDEEKILLDIHKMGSIGYLDKIQVNTNKIILHRSDSIYLYSLDDKSFKKIMDIGNHNLAYSKKYKKIIFEKKRVLYKSNLGGSNVERIGEIAVSAFFYNYIVFIDEDTFLYQTFSKDDKRVVIKYNLKDDTKQVIHKTFVKKNCFPAVYLANGNFICRDNSKENQGIYTIDADTGITDKLNIEISGKYIYYMKDLNAIFYMKEAFNLSGGETFETRVYFLDTKKDVLWSRKYLQPIEFLEGKEKK